MFLAALLKLAGQLAWRVLLAGHALLFRNGPQPADPDTEPTAVH